MTGLLFHHLLATQDRDRWRRVVATEFRFVSRLSTRSTDQWWWYIIFQYYIVNILLYTSAVIIRNKAWPDLLVLIQILIWGHLLLRRNCSYTSGVTMFKVFVCSQGKSCYDSDWHNTFFTNDYQIVIFYILVYLHFPQ